MYYHNPSKPATPAQLRLLTELGVAIPERLNSYRADLLIKEHSARWSLMPPTAKQECYLRYRGHWRAGMTRAEATQLIRTLSGNTDWPIGPTNPSGPLTTPEEDPDRRNAVGGEPADGQNKINNNDKAKE